MKKYRYQLTPRGEVLLDDGANIHVKAIGLHGEECPVISVPKRAFAKRGMVAVAADDAPVDQVIATILDLG